MKGSRNTARQQFGLTLTLVGLLSWNTLPIHLPERAVQAATRASVTEPTGQQVSRAVANGRIAFVSGEGNAFTDIYTMNPDGSNVQRLTNSNLAHYYFDPAWSPDGSKIAFVRFSGTYNDSLRLYTDIVYEIFVMNADGSDQRRLTQSRSDFSPAWSPDGTQIAFWRDMPSSRGIFVMNADGSDQRAVASTSELGQPAWSPDGLKFAVTDFNFFRIYLINVDGSNQTQITQPPASFEDHNPAWSPDGSKITFTRGTGCFWGCETEHLWVVNADGSNPTKLTDTLANTHAWSPDGTKIIGSQGGDLFVMNPDGSGLTNITNTNDKHEQSPSWQPLPLPPVVNPIDDPQFFVRQQYLDFLNREPDSAGYNDWLSVLYSCGTNQGGLGSDPACDRVHVSSGFFRSPEFGEKGYWIYRFFESSLGRRPQFAEFLPEMQKLSGSLTDAELAARKADFIARFMQLPEFTNIYAGITDSTHAAQFITKLEEKARVTLPASATTESGQPPQYGRQQLIDLMSSGQFNAAQTLRAFIEQKVVWDTYFYRAFVAMQYFGYLRRDPEAAGYDDWVDVLTNGRASAGVQPGDYRHLIFGFIYSIEYRGRFGQP